MNWRRLLFWREPKPAPIPGLDELLRHSEEILGPSVWLPGGRFDVKTPKPTRYVQPPVESHRYGPRAEDHRHRFRLVDRGAPGDSWPTFGKPFKPAKYGCDCLASFLARPL